MAITFVLSINLVDFIIDFPSKNNVKPCGSKERVDGGGKFNSSMGNSHGFRKFGCRSATAVSLFRLLTKNPAG
jgi:hypothetical protein